MLADAVVPFSPVALIAYVDRRRPIAEVAALFGMDRAHLNRCITNLRDDNPAFPVRRVTPGRGVYLDRA